MKEQWKKCPGYTLYEVSDRGRVWSMRHERLLSACPNRRGYPQVSLHKGKKWFSRRVHSLVARAFHGPARGREVNHKNGNKTDNRRANLEWLTKKQHAKHTRDVLKADNWASTGRAVKRRGARRALSPARIRQLHKRHARGETVKALAEEEGVSKHTLYRLGMSCKARGSTSGC